MSSISSLVHEDMVISSHLYNNNDYAQRVIENKQYENTVYAAIVVYIIVVYLDIYIIFHNLKILKVLYQAVRKPNM